MATTANVLVGDAEITLGVGINAVVIGYTVDGVDMTISSELADIKVEDNEGTLIRRLVDQEVQVTLNVGEGTLVNLEAAIPGSSLADPILTIGGTTLQSSRLTLVGTNPAGYPRVIVLTEVNPTGEVATPYKKGDVSVVPMTFSALIDDSSNFGTVTDAAAVAPTLVVGVNTKSNAAGTIIEADFTVNMTAPAGKHLEFWFTEVGVARAFSLAAIGGAPTTIDLTVSGVAIAGAAALKLYYALGTVTSVATGVLASFANQTVVPR